MLFKILTILVFIGILFSCSGDDKKYDEFFNVYEEILKTRIVEVDSVISQNKVDSLLKAHKMSQDDFKNLMIEMSKEKDDFVPRLQKLREEILSKKDSLINGK